MIGIINLMLDTGQKLGVNLSGLLKQLTIYLLALECLRATAKSY